MAKAKKNERYHTIIATEFLGVVHVRVIARRGSHSEEILNERVCVDRDKVKSDKKARKLAKQAIIRDTIEHRLPKLRP